MKIYVCFVAIFSALVLVHCRNILSECTKEISSSDESISRHLDDMRRKCWSACVMRKKGIMSDGEIVVETVLEFFKKDFPNGGEDTAAKAALTECAVNANEGKGECEVAESFEKCVMKMKLRQ